MFRKKPSVLNVVSDLNKTTVQILSNNAEVIQQIKDTLNKDEERILDYFWNRRKQKLRQRISELVILFFETDDANETVFDVIRAYVDRWTFELKTKGYISEGRDQFGKYFELTPNGVNYVKDQHPTVLAYWKRLLELSPPTVSLIAAMIGFIASVFGIILFVAWLRGN